MNLTRRSVLTGTGAALATGALAGCLDDSGLTSETDGIESGYGAFFTLYDWTEQISGEVAAFENPIPAGEMGHGWEPEGNLARDIASTDAFVYFDIPEFSWSQDIADTLEEDYDEITVIDGLEGVDLLEWGNESSHEDESDGHDHEDENESHEEGGDDHENESHDEHDHEDDGHENGHGDVDPHVWVDPVRAKQVVDTITAGLADADPDNAETFEDNAGAYKERLDDLDEQFQNVFDDADHDTVVVAGHDSYAYLEDRYGFEIHTPSGVSPHDTPNSTDIADTIELIDDRGIDTILYDYFGSSNLAETIVENSDATTIERISPGEGTTTEWDEQGWGYVEQMEELNVPAFENAVRTQQS
ncbi:metal ABC transporter solute-binding protein, Zn/Mn family [Halomontanus rarus]|uniref:metal ABC transporter solute-binding protein, Zn/Mn family n=1 Tax=Halomontanus rarus TaxID=3034020 RepID=UPI0023E759E8|nr:zinc ABC transporter substrate-binding protein [Halovivax sp. TS33]